MKFIILYCYFFKFLWCFVNIQLHTINIITLLKLFSVS
mgnify:CR=1 FL=1